MTDPTEIHKGGAAGTPRRPILPLLPTPIRQRRVSHSPALPDYRYCWFRDGAYIAYAMGLTGERESARRFHDWCARVVNQRRAVVERAIEKGNRSELLAEVDYLHTRYTLEGHEGDNATWPNFQLDGLGTWLWALAPLAGPWAKYLFNVGLLGASLLAASVLPLATTYAVCEAFGWERGTNNRPQEAPVFYGLYTGLVVLSAAVVLLPSVPLFLLMWLSQALNAILLPVLLVLMLRLANDARLMGVYRNGRMTNALAWGLTGLIVLITLILFAVPLRQASASRIY